MFKLRLYGGLGYEDMRLVSVWIIWGCEERLECRIEDLVGFFFRIRLVGKLLSSKG